MLSEKRKRLHVSVTEELAEYIEEHRKRNKLTSTNKAIEDLLMQNIQADSQQKVTDYIAEVAGQVCLNSINKRAVL